MVGNFRSARRLEQEARNPVIGNLLLYHLTNSIKTKLIQQLLL